METVVVEIDPVENSNAVEEHVPAVENPDAMISTAGKENVAHGDPFAIRKNDEMRALDIWRVGQGRGARLARPGCIPMAGKKAGAIAVDRAVTVDDDICGVGREQQHDISVARIHAPAVHLV